MILDIKPIVSSSIPAAMNNRSFRFVDCLINPDWINGVFITVDITNRTSVIDLCSTLLSKGNRWKDFSYLLMNESSIATILRDAYFFYSSRTDMTVQRSAVKLFETVITEAITRGVAPLWRGDPADAPIIGTVLANITMHCLNAWGSVLAEKSKSYLLPDRPLIPSRDDLVEDHLKVELADIFRRWFGSFNPEPYFKTTPAVVSTTFVENIFIDPLARLGHDLYGLGKVGTDINIVLRCILSHVLPDDRLPLRSSLRDSPIVAGLATNFTLFRLACDSFHQLNFIGKGIDEWEAALSAFRTRQVGSIFKAIQLMTIPELFSCYISTGDRAEIEAFGLGLNYALQPGVQVYDVSDVKHPFIKGWQNYGTGVDLGAVFKNAFSKLDVSVSTIMSLVANVLRYHAREDITYQQSSSSDKTNVLHRPVPVFASFGLDEEPGLIELLAVALAKSISFELDRVDLTADAYDKEAVFNEFEAMRLKLQSPPKMKYQISNERARVLFPTDWRDEFVSGLLLTTDPVYAVVHSFPVDSREPNATAWFYGSEIIQGRANPLPLEIVDNVLRISDDDMSKLLVEKSINTPFSVGVPWSSSPQSRLKIEPAFLLTNYSDADKPYAYVNKIDKRVMALLVDSIGKMVATLSKDNPRDSLVYSTIIDSVQTIFLPISESALIQSQIRSLPMALEPTGDQEKLQLFLRSIHNRTEWEFTMRDVLALTWLAKTGKMAYNDDRLFLLHLFSQNMISGSVRFSRRLDTKNLSNRWLL